MKSETATWRADTRAAVRAAPRWFGPADRRLFGWLHRPAGGEARAIVVICPSLGQEAVFAHYTLRSTAEELADLGFLVLRFDYLGTGDSADNAGSADVVGDWVDSVADAIGHARGLCAAPLVLVGFRAGALPAVEAAARTDVDALVLWDAPSSGRRFLRELAVRHNVSVGGAGTEHGFAALGVVLSEPTRARFSRLSLAAHTPLPARVALRLDRGDAAAPDGEVTRAGTTVDRLAAPDQDDLLERKALPVRTQRQAVGWIDAAYPQQRFPLIDDTSADDAADDAADGAAPATRSLTFAGGVEHAVRVGPNQLFGIVTEPTVPARTTSTVVFVPDSITPHSGLSRIWTQLAREWAAAGIRSLRFDISGCGDSPVRRGVEPHVIGQLAHLDDAADAVRFASPDDPADTIVIGLCSGAYLSTEIALDTPPRALGLINPVLSFITPEPVPHPRRRAVVLTRRVVDLLVGRPAGKLAERLSRSHQTPAFTLDPDFPWHRAFEACFWQVYLSDVAPRLPDRVWRVLNRLLTTTPGIDRILEPVRRRGTRILMIAGELDYPRSTLGARRKLRELGRDGGVRVEHEPGLDHAMMRPGTTELVAASLTRFVFDVTQADR